MSPLEFFLTFLKASLFSTGGFGPLPSLHQDLLANNFATDQDFGQALAVSQISPGPTGLWVVALGYLTYGFLGAFLALIAVTLPPLLVLVLAAVYNRVEERPVVQGIIRGVSLAVVGLLLVVVWSILSAPGMDWRGIGIALGAFGLASTGKINLALVLGLAALSGYFIFS